MQDKKITIKDLFENMNKRLNNIEEVMLNNRLILHDLVEQVNYLSAFYEELLKADEINVKSISEEELKMIQIKEMIDSYVDRSEDLKELEEELKKNKDKITPGQAGEA